MGSNNVNDLLEWQAIQIYHENKPIHIINIYSPGSMRKISKTELDNIISMFSPSAIICGDFNSHNPLWDAKCKHSDDRGNTVQAWLEEHNLVFLNDGEGTRIDFVTGNTSAIDLTITTPDLAPKSSWNVIPDTLGSDHFAIMTELGMSPQSEVNLNNPKFLFHKANWENFKKDCQNIFIDDDCLSDIDLFNQKLTDNILRIAEQHIPISSQHKRATNPVPWWNSECAANIRNKKRALRKFKRTRLHTDHEKYKNLKIEAEKSVSRAKAKYWENYCGTLDTKTNSKQVWNKLKHIQGKTINPIPTLDHKHKINEEKAECLAKTFAENSSDRNLNPTFKIIKDNTFLQLEPDDHVEHDLNKDFSLQEYHKAIHYKKETSPGEDKLGYKILKHLPLKTQNIILKLINTSWRKKQLPQSWKSSIVIPIQKTGKNPSDSSSYRPISLTSCLCKLMETMVKNRLEFHLAKNKVLNETQSGFRKGRSTYDHLTKLQHQIRKGISRREFTLAVFLDIEKAFDLVWQDGVILQFDQLGIKGRIQHWIYDFLRNRNFKVRLGQTSSKRHTQQNGTPQGSVLSPTLFNILINGLANAIDSNHPKIEQSLFADDAAIWKTGKSIKKIKDAIQKTLNTISNWADHWGFKFSATKTTGIVFTNRRKVNIELFIGKKKIEIKEKVKYLGMILDSRLTWKDHIDDLTIRCQRDLNLMRCISGTKWGANKTTLIKMYQCLIRSKIDYGAIVYQSACKTLLQRIDSIQYSALKVATGAFKGTSLCSLQVETLEKPLHLRREQLTLKYAGKISAYGNTHPCYNLILPYSEYEYLEKKWTKHSAPIGYEINRLLCKYDIALPKQQENVYQQPPWLLQTPQIDIALHDQISKLENPVYIKAQALEHFHEHYNGHLKIYTDGSKNVQGHTGSSFAIPDLNIVKNYKLPNHLSVYTSELVAITMALQWILENKPNRVAILSDSLSGIISIQNSKSESRPDLLQEIISLTDKIQKQKTDLTLAWVPAHVNIRGNEIADQAAKSSLRKYEQDIDVPLSQNEIYTLINTQINNQWKEEWDKESRGRWHYKILNGTITKLNSFQLLNNQDDKNISRLRLGKTGLKAHLATIIQNSSPTCPACQEHDETIEHYLLQCIKHSKERRRLAECLQIYKCELDLQTILNPKPHLRAQIFSLLKEYIKSTGYESRI